MQHKVKVVVDGKIRNAAIEADSYDDAVAKMKKRGMQIASEIPPADAPAPASPSVPSSQPPAPGRAVLEVVSRFRIHIAGGVMVLVVGFIIGYFGKGDLRKTRDEALGRAAAAESQLTEAATRERAQRLAAERDQSQISSLLAQVDESNRSREALKAAYEGQIALLKQQADRHLAESTKNMQQAPGRRAVQAWKALMAAYIEARPLQKDRAQYWQSMLQMTNKIDTTDLDQELAAHITQTVRLSSDILLVWGDFSTRLQKIQDDAASIHEAANAVKQLNPNPMTPEERLGAALLTVLGPAAAAESQSVESQKLAQEFEPKFKEIDQRIAALRGALDPLQQALVQRYVMDFPVP